MTIDSVIEILKWVALFMLGATSLYYQTNARLSCHVANLIVEAERTYKGTAKAGREKFEWVVSSLYGMIPPVLKPFISRPMLEKLVQSTFDAMEQYAMEQLNKITFKGLDEQRWSRKWSK